MTTLVGTQVIFPKGGETYVGLSRQAPGPLPCPSGDIIAPFAVFPPPRPGAARWFRLKAVYFDENAGGQYHVQVIFNMTSGNTITFNFPQVASAAGASNFHYSDWYKGNPVDTSYARVNAFFVNAAYYNNSAGIYSLILEAHDIYLPGTASDHSYTVTVTNQSNVALETHAGDFIAAGSNWTSEPLGNGFVQSPLLGTLSFYDLGTNHIDGDSGETYGCLIGLHGWYYVGRYNAAGQLNVTVNSVLQAVLGTGGMTINAVNLDAIITE